MARWAIRARSSAGKGCFFARVLSDVSEAVYWELVHPESSRDQHIRDTQTQARVRSGFVHNDMPRTVRRVRKRDKPRGWQLAERPHNVGSYLLRYRTGDGSHGEGSARHIVLPYRSEVDCSIFRALERPIDLRVDGAIGPSLEVSPYQRTTGRGQVHSMSKIEELLEGQIGDSHAQ
jgi:hypothetical protein